MEFYYLIEGLFPLGEEKLGHCGFFIHLDRDFARKALTTKLQEQQNERYQAQAKEIIRRSRLEGIFASSTPYHFFEDTCLLQFCTAPEDACDLGVEPGDIKLLEREVSDKRMLKISKQYNTPLRYIPHNVDSPLQAYVLLGLWTHWANTIKFVIKNK